MEKSNIMLMKQSFVDVHAFPLEYSYLSFGVRRLFGI
jgi:hypothetical protein